MKSKILDFIGGAVVVIGFDIYILWALFLAPANIAL